MSKTKNIDEVLEFYENGAEINRLERGLGIIEAARTKEILSRYVKPGMTVYDVGGGVGYYSNWLAGLGCEVTLFELAPVPLPMQRATRLTPIRPLLPMPVFFPLRMPPVTSCCSWAHCITSWGVKTAYRPYRRPCGCFGPAGC